MSKHQIEVPDDVWAWAQERTEQKVPASFLREILIRSMCSGGSTVQVSQGVTKTSPLASRWAMLGLEKEPSDTRYHVARSLWINEHDSELEALEAAEKLAKTLTRDQELNMRGYIIWWSKQVLASR